MTTAPGRIGCVSFLNAKPLIEGIEGRARVTFDVPSRLLEDLERGRVDIALCPVIDYQRSDADLRIVPVGGIGCEGPTLTVRLFSQVPLPEIDTVHADTDSHTSVALMQVILAEVYGRRPSVVPFDARARADAHPPAPAPRSLLLIGDKVVIDAPSAEQYPHQLDLGEAWRDMTELPFVFAVWMAKADTPLGDLPALLERTRIANAQRIDAIAARHAPRHGWPLELARQYLGHMLRYAVGVRELAAIERFGALCAAHQLIPRSKSVRVRMPAVSPPGSAVRAAP